MPKKVSFNKVKKALIELNKKSCRNLPKYQLEANEQLFNTILSNIENGKMPCWFWPTLERVSKKPDFSGIIIKFMGGSYEQI